MPAGDRESDRGGESETGSSEEISFEEQYRETAINCFRYFHFTSFEQVDRMTIAQYEIMLEALEYQMVDDEYFSFKGTIYKREKGKDSG